MKWIHNSWTGRLSIYDVRDVPFFVRKALFINTLGSIVEKEVLPTIQDVGDTLSSFYDLITE